MQSNIVTPNKDVLVFAKLITRRRKSLCLTQEQVAREVGITQGALSKHENGELEPGLYVGLKLLKLYKITSTQARMALEITHE